MMNNEDIKLTSDVRVAEGFNHTGTLPENKYKSFLLTKLAN
jgi:hypothetical protein